MTPAIHSSRGQGRLKATISFSNQTEGKISISPINDKGARQKKRVKRLEAGEDVSVNSRIGNVYVVESADGKVHEVHSPSFPERTIVIGGK